jgi:hypothetical protein
MARRWHRSLAGGFMVDNRLSIVGVMLATAALLVPATVRAQQPRQNAPETVQQTQADVERTVKRFAVGVEGGVAVDPELVEFGGHAAFAPVFSPNVEFRPGVEFGLGEVTTLFGINLDVLYILPGATESTRWAPYVGAGPTFGLSHQSFDSGSDTSHVSVTGTSATGTTTTTESRNRFNFSDTDFNGGFNFVVGARSSRTFFEMKATAGGVSNIRLLGGYNF